MKAILSAAVLCAATLLAGCSSGSGSSTNVNPVLTTVYVTQNNALVSTPVAVTLSTSVSGSAATGTIIATQNTSQGVTTFTNLPAGGQLCVSGTIGAEFQSSCAQPFPTSVTLNF
ncbi:MAG: hypothetical protein WAJ85_04255 [Candidatus Baltobacteraceae bacterium]|jgi:hypothetical protein